MAVGIVAPKSGAPAVQSGTKALRVALVSCAASLAMIALLMVAKGANGRSSELASAGLISQEAMTTNSELASAPAIPAKAIDSAANKAVKVIAKDSQKLQDESDGNDMSREIAELAKQEKIHFEARQKALQAAVAATAACKEDDPDYKACIHAAEKINWKMAKDKYEQAAMKDITKENADQEATAQGQVIFDKYSKLADALSGTKGFNNLYNSTTHAEKARNAKEASAIANLKKERQQLHQLEKEKAAIRHEEQKKAQAKANKEEKESLEREMSGITNGKKYQDMYKDAAAGDAVRQKESFAKIAAAKAAYQEARRHNVASHKELKYIDTNPYSADYEAAEKAEVERKSAFKKYVAELKAKDEAARAERKQLLAHEGQAKNVAAAKVVSSSSTLPAAAAGKPGYSKDVSKALEVDAKDEAKEEKALEADEARDAKLEAKKNGVQQLPGAQKAPKPVLVSKPAGSDVMSSEGYESAVAAAKIQEALKVKAEAAIRDESRVARAKTLAAKNAKAFKEASGNLAKTADGIVGIFGKKKL